MAGTQSAARAKCLSTFLNVSFLFLISCLTTHLWSSNSDYPNLFKPSISGPNQHQIIDADLGCEGLHNLPDGQSKCFYVKTHGRCESTGYIPYLYLFYCTFSPVLGHTLLILWLVLLFYLLGDTAATYFCPSLEGLSTILKLSPTLSGVTLLSLGNGAPDLFASIVSFMGDGTQDIGLNSILGGALFVSSIVVGVISISVCSRTRSIDKSSFVRDVLFFLLVLFCLLVIVILGEFNLWTAISFLSLYFIYVIFISFSQICTRNGREREDSTLGSPVMSPNGSFLGDDPPRLSELGVPLLGCVVVEKSISINEGEIQVAEEKSSLSSFRLKSSSSCWFGSLLCILELPLTIPRRLTIPVISEERWSKPFAVASGTIAPVVLAFIWNSQGPKPSMLIYAVVGLIGAVLGVVSFFTTERSSPPRKCLLPWLAGGFLMSVTWTYVLAQELISVLVSLGQILGIAPSILGLTVLAWGNSLGDLVANVTMAKNGGPRGTKIAISACYAGPIFNTLVGLGLSLVLSSWTVHPSKRTIARDPFVFETMGFLMGSLLWALVVLPRRSMTLDGFFGCGLLVIYFCFLALKMARALGLLQHGSPPVLVPRKAEAPFPFNFNL